MYFYSVESIQLLFTLSLETLFSSFIHSIGTNSSSISSIGSSRNKIRCICDHEIVLYVSCGPDILCIEKKSQELKQILKGHASPISCLITTKTKLWSGSDDASICLWDLMTGDCFRQISQQFLPVADLLLVNQTVWSSGETSIYVWDAENGNLIQNLEKISRQSLTQMTKVKRNVLTASMDGSVLVWK